MVPTCSPSKTTIRCTLMPVASNSVRCVPTSFGGGDDVSSRWKLAKMRPEASYRQASTSDGFACRASRIPPATVRSSKTSAAEQVLPMMSAWISSSRDMRVRKLWRS